jgi:DNA-binding transcriptional LysR family regulator
MNDPRIVDLDEEARTIIDAARDMHEPSAQHRARVRRAIETELAGSVGVAAPHVSSAWASPTLATLIGAYPAL